MIVIAGLDPVIFPGTVLEQMAGSGPGHDVVGVRAKSQSLGHLVLVINR
jgi:hypothetical protein